VEFFLWLRRGPAGLGADEIATAVSTAGVGEPDERLTT
jgi:hypothetical protein